MQHTQSTASEEDVEYHESDVLEHLAAAKLVPGTPEAHAAYLRAANEIRTAFVAGVSWKDIAEYIGKTQKSTRQLVAWALSAQYENADNFTFPHIAPRSDNRSDNTTTTKELQHG